ncbi:hypothetical protein Lcho_2268 [Leptothrix cholodnii SP-6]|uniref:Uncharacterized protein n=1 Tax=Leptothrix cholodnii (strain ATCC 51168 / LMG 8142 / SP-6) TaxID=395495 RepID=B1Y412_LEPCP|nr:hypothetical protein [Leptothrix cholodnii]ACB34534.1 hypothetical protein Lcho_2268 [Leptothrix cholodnii SP-6]
MNQLHVGSHSPAPMPPLRLLGQRHLGTHADLTQALLALVGHVSELNTQHTDANRQRGVTQRQLDRQKTMALALLVMLLEDMRPGLGMLMERLVMPDDVIDASDDDLDLHEAVTVPAPLSPLAGL